tara:strand:- start:4201 stop:4353 length:153 start_codon:yes stop_codon:yes gene_type:complete
MKSYSKRILKKLYISKKKTKEGKKKNLYWKTYNKKKNSTMSSFFIFYQLV